MKTTTPPQRIESSRHPEFDRKFAEKLRREHPEIWAKGGNIRGNAAYELWGKARRGQYTAEVIAWLRERDAWIARHYEDFRLAGVIAQIKWGTIGRRGAEYMKGVVKDALQRAAKRQHRPSRSSVGADWTGSSSELMANPDAEVAAIIELLLNDREFDAEQRVCLYEELLQNPAYPLLLLDDSLVRVVSAYDRFLRPDAGVLLKATDGMMDNADAVQGEGGTDWEPYVAEWVTFLADWKQRYPALWTQGLEESAEILRRMLRYSDVVRRQKPRTVERLIEAWLKKPVQGKYRGFDAMLQECANYADPISFIPDRP